MPTLHYNKNKHQTTRQWYYKYYTLNNSYTSLHVCSHTDHKQLVVLAQFPVGYPSQILLVELKSKTLPATLLDGLIRVCDNELQKHIGSDQVCVYSVPLIVTSNEWVWPELY